jgi:hypothetical protein
MTQDNMGGLMVAGETDIRSADVPRSRSRRRSCYYVWPQRVFSYGVAECMASAESLLDEMSRLSTVFEPSGWVCSVAE